MPMGIKKWGHGERENLRPSGCGFRGDFGTRHWGQSAVGAASCTVAALLHNSSATGRATQDIGSLRVPLPGNSPYALSEDAGGQNARDDYNQCTGMLRAAGVRAELVRLSRTPPPDRRARHACFLVRFAALYPSPPSSRHSRDSDSDSLRAP
ncbi:hypothetical protein K438DRAFT_1977338 [Mycena galopus ATCC 62051]|nr:hypothetical protein K438DRAFT_1977338 [Mycena galopus ATCC 62051]